MTKAGRPLKPRKTPFGRRLADARKRANLTQAQLGKSLGLSQRAIAHWELGDTAAPLRPEQIETLSKIFDVSIEELFLGSNSVKPKKRPGPKNKLYEVFEEAAQLSKREQQQVIAVVSAMIDQSKAFV